MDCDIDSNYVQGTYPLRDGRILGVYSENYGMVFDAAESASTLRQCRAAGR